MMTITFIFFIGMLFHNLQKGHDLHLKSKIIHHEGKSFLIMKMKKKLDLT